MAPWGPLAQGHDEPLQVSGGHLAHIFDPTQELSEELQAELHPSLSLRAEVLGRGVEQVARQLGVQAKFTHFPQWEAPSLCLLERKMGFEPTTSSLARRRSTAELLPQPIPVYEGVTFIELTI